MIKKVLVVIVFLTVISNISALDISGKFVAPSEIDVKPDSTAAFDIVVGHDGSFPGDATFDVRLTPVQDSNIDETKVKAKVISETPIKLKPGQQGLFVVQVVAASDAPISVQNKTPAYSLTVTANGQHYATSAFLIHVTNLPRNRVGMHVKPPWYCFWMFNRLESCKVKVYEVKELLGPSREGYGYGALD